jgi:hypothetical protein
MSNKALERTREGGDDASGGYSGPSTGGIPGNGGKPGYYDVKMFCLLFIKARGVPEWKIVWK